MLPQGVDNNPLLSMEKMRYEKRVLPTMLSEFITDDDD